MRCAQVVGLTTEATEFLAENVLSIPDVTCPNCGKVISYKQASSIYDSGGDDLSYFNSPSLRQYRLKDGTILREIVQTEIWSSGPMYFLCLEKENGETLFKWKRDDSLRNSGMEVDYDNGTYWV